MIKKPDMKAIFILTCQVSSECEFLHLLLERNNLTEPVFKGNVLCNAWEQQEIGSCMCTFFGHFRLQLMAEGWKETRRYSHAVVYRFPP